MAPSQTSSDRPEPTARPTAPAKQAEVPPVSDKPEPVDHDGLLDNVSAGVMSEAIASGRAVDPETGRELELVKGDDGAVRGVRYQRSADQARRDADARAKYVPGATSRDDNNPLITSEDVNAEQAAYRPGESAPVVKAGKDGKG